MKGYKVYSKIQQLKSLGFKRAAVAKQLKANWRTVDRYWDMSPEEFEASLRRLNAPWNWMITVASFCRG